MPLKKKCISISSESARALANETNVSRATVYNALNYTTNSELAQKIRRLAMETYGGVEATRVVW